MPISIIVGGQFGSEGKGKVANHFARKREARAVVKVGGINSGHTVVDPDNGRPQILRQLPAAVIGTDAYCIFPPGSYIDPFLLRLEIERTGFDRSKLFIDPKAMIIEPHDEHEEIFAGLRQRIGSTESGTGAAVAKRVSRPEFYGMFAGDWRDFKPFIKDTAAALSLILKTQGRILIEGTQGFGLSLLHSPHYPYVTSRDTTAAGFLSEAGLSPLDVDEIVLVLRAFPIWVAGNSGELKNETSWESITRESGSSAFIKERTSVTGQIRRVARFDPDIVQEAITANNPTSIVLNHLDYLPGVHAGDLAAARRFAAAAEPAIARRIDYFGLGPDSLVRRDKFFQEELS